MEFLGLFMLFMAHTNKVHYQLYIPLKSELFEVLLEMVRGGILGAQSAFKISW